MVDILLNFEVHIRVFSFDNPLSASAHKQTPLHSRLALFYINMQLFFYLQIYVRRALLVVFL